MIQTSSHMAELFVQNKIYTGHWLELYTMYLYRKQASLWAQGDIHRSKQRQYEDRSVPHLISSMDNLSINTSIFKSHSLDRMEEVRPAGPILFLKF